MLDPGLGDLRNLTRIDLSHNKLNEVPREMGNLDKLTLFDLRENALSAPPNAVVNAGAAAIVAFLKGGPAGARR